MSSWAFTTGISAKQFSLQTLGRVLSFSPGMAAALPVCLLYLSLIRSLKLHSLRFCRKNNLGSEHSCLLDQNPLETHVLLNSKGEREGGKEEIYTFLMQ